MSDKKKKKYEDLVIIPKDDDSDYLEHGFDLNETIANYSYNKRDSRDESDFLRLIEEDEDE